MLATRNGKCIRCAVNSVRQFSGRTSTGVRGIKLAKGDEIISMTVLDSVGFSIEERDAYLRQANKERRGEDEPVENDAETVTITPERYAQLAKQEQFIISVTNKGYGKRSSAYEYRQTGRGGQGFASMDLSAKNGKVIASFPVEETDQLMLVTDNGKLIRCPINDVRIAGRRTQGVRLFRIDDKEQVVSVARVPDSEAIEDEQEDDE